MNAVRTARRASGQTGARGRRTRSLVLGGAVLLCLVAMSGVAVGAIVGTPNSGHLVAVGPTSGDNGFPVWYKDDTGLRLEPCVDPKDRFCPSNTTAGVIPDTTKPVSFPDNFPNEFFYQLAQSTFTLPNGNKALGVFNLEASFAGPTPVKPAAGQQIVFGRIRFRMDGLQPGATYTITHPYGVDQVQAVNGSINYTEDVGLAPGQFGDALNSRIGPFLKWDPQVPPAAPAGYIGDGATPHAITGSPYNTNVFRIQGPGVGSGVTGANACPTASNDCIQSTLFTVQGKIATTAGVNVDRATYSRAAGASGGTLDVFAASETGPQSLQVSGSGLSTTRLRGEAGHYEARVPFTGPPPAKVTVTNVGDVPATSKDAAITDAVTSSAVYDADAQTLTIKAESSDKASPPALTATGFGALGADGSLVVNTVSGTPANVTITSSAGGSVTVPVTMTGATFAAIGVQAFAGPDQQVLTGKTVTLDGSGSTGPITGYSWKQVSGPAVTLGGAGTKTATFTAPSTVAAGGATLDFDLTVAGDGGPVTDRVTVTVVSSAAAVSANAGPDQVNVTQGSIIQLDGSASTGATTYAWTQVAGPAVTLNGPNTATPSFTFPIKNAVVTLRLTASGPGGSATDDVSISPQPDRLTMTRAQYNAGKREWRVEGTSSIADPQVVVTVHAGPTLAGEVIGKANVDAFGAWRVRVAKSAVPGNVSVSAESSSGGQLLNQPVA
jgi:hypothetical protein